MTSYEFMQVDAFTDRALGGNPCAILFDADDLDTDTMQAIALENNLSETAFVMASDGADFRVRYFTPSEEVPMAGHPTIATTHALVETGRITMGDSPVAITLEMQVGPIRVDVTPRTGQSPLITMTQQPPRFLREHDPAETLPIFGLSRDDLVQGVPIQTVSTGTPQMMIAVRDRDALRRAAVNHAAYPAFRAREHFFSPHLFCIEGATEEGATFARHFGTPPDIFEDPFTGSATGGMAAYIWHHGLIDEPRFIAEQGHWMNRPGRAQVEVLGPRDAIDAVRVGGPAVTTIVGEFRL